MKRLGNERGMVLLLVLAVVALLTSLVAEMAFSTLVDMRLTETFRDTTRAWYLAKGGVEAGRMILQEDRNGYDHPGELWGQGVPAFPVGEDGTVSIAIEDLSSRLDINRLAQGDNPNSNMVRRFYRLFTELGLPDAGDLTAALVDWVDTGDDPYTKIILSDETQVPVEGAENDYYARQPNPYGAANAPLTALDELKLVRGFTDEVIRRITPYVTVYGSDRLNLNTAPAPVILAWDADVTPETVEKIVTAREESPLESTAAVRTLIGLDAFSALNRNGDVDVKSGTYLIRATGEVNDGRRTALAYIEKGATHPRYLKVE